MKVLIGTNNKAKVLKYGTILKELDIEYVTPNDLNLNVKIDENGNTIEENSIIKAKAYYEKTKMPVIVDDSGLILEGLEKEEQPGVFVRRYTGKELTDEEIITIFSKKISKLGGKVKGAFDIAISIADKNGKIFTKTNKHERLFVSNPCNERTIGYPMNSLIYDEKTKKYLAQVYEGKEIYKGNTFEQDFKFIKQVLLGE